MNFYPFHIGDYLSHTLHLSDEEDLAYRRMMDLYYMTEQPFKDEIFVARRVKTTPAIALVLLNEFFEQSEDGWHNKRADEEIAKYQAMQEGGRKGAAKRWHKPSNSPPTATPMQTKNQEPRTINQEPRTKNQDLKTKTLKPLPTAKAIGDGVSVWEAYSQAYLQRYHTLPVRNARTNALCQQLVVRLGSEDAPHVAAFFVHHSNGFYVTKGHALAVLLGDAEKVRTEWVTGRRITHTAAQQADRTQTTGDVFRELKTELNQRSA